MKRKMRNYRLDLAWRINFFWKSVDKNGPIPTNRPELGPCWICHRKVGSNGYIHMTKFQLKRTRPHRLAYELVKGPIPQGLHIDHLCRNRICVNPDHMEPVTLVENVMRGESIFAKQARQTHCKRGHEFDEANTYVYKTGNRQCKKCMNLRYQLRKEGQHDRTPDSHTAA